jgi:hypothetical protein
MSPRARRGWQEILAERFPERAREIEHRMTTEPTELVEEMRSDGDMVRAVVEADIVSSLEQWFTARDDRLTFTDGRAGPVGEREAGAEWTYAGVHDEAGTLRGLPATDRAVEVHGFTVVGVGTDDDGQETLLLTRHIDWAGLYAQLGLTINWRVPLDPEPEEG